MTVDFEKTTKACLDVTRFQYYLTKFALFVNGDVRADQTDINQTFMRFLF